VNQHNKNISLSLMLFLSNCEGVISLKSETKCILALDTFTVYLSGGAASLTRMFLRDKSLCIILLSSKYLKAELICLALKTFC
jgi:hypothetical protein